MQEQIRSKLNQSLDQLSYEDYVQIKPLIEQLARQPHDDDFTVQKVKLAARAAGEHAASYAYKTKKGLTDEIRETVYSDALSAFICKGIITTELSRLLNMTDVVGLFNDAFLIGWNRMKFEITERGFKP